MSASVKRLTLLVFVLAIVTTWNLAQTDRSRFAFAETPVPELVTIDPQAASIILGSIDQYTPIIEESKLTLTDGANSGIREGFISSSQSTAPFETQETELEQEYHVQKGDTLIEIAKKFSVTVATLIERNGFKLEEIENLKQGSVVMVPPRSTSDSTTWLAKLNEKKESERKAAIARAQKAKLFAASTVRASSGFSGNSNRDFIVPIAHNGVTRGLSRSHMGIDYRANTGTSVKAADDGKVIEITRGWAGGFGISVLVDHGGGLNTRYAHLSSVAVGIGETVSRGQVVAHSGNSGFSTGPHLHFETRLNGRAINPF